MRAGELDSIINDAISNFVKLNNNYVSPFEFGALCNGIVDDAVAIRAALKYLSENGGGTLNLMNNKVYTLDSLENDYFFKLKNNCNIVGNSILRVKNNFGDYNYIFTADENIDNVVLRDFTIDENTTNNAPTENTGKTGYKRITFRLIAKNYYLKNVLFENIKIDDCLGTWQYEFEAQCDNIKLDKCIINYNKTHIVDYDRTSIYFGVNNGTITNCVLNGSDNARTGIELHGHNIICTNNIITNYNSGVYIVNDKTVPYDNANRFLNVANNKIEVRKRGIMNWFSFDEIDTETVMIHNNYIHILNTDTSGVVAVGNYDILGENITIKNLKIHDNIIVSENEETNGIRLSSTSSSANAKFENIEIYNNVVKGVFEFAVRLLSNANNTFNIDNLYIENNKFIIDNNISNTIFTLLRSGIKQISIKHNHFTFKGAPSYLFKTGGVADAELLFDIIDNDCDYNFIPTRFLNGDVQANVKHEFNSITFVNSSSSNILKDELYYKDGSILKDKNFTLKKVSGKWIAEYVGDDMPLHVPIFKGSNFRLANNENYVQRTAKKNGFSPDHVAGTNKIGDWVYNDGYVVVYESLTNNNINFATVEDKTNFKYIGQLATYENITVE